LGSGSSQAGLSSSPEDPDEDELLLEPNPPDEEPGWLPLALDGGGAAELPVLVEWEELAGGVMLPDEEGLELLRE